LTSNKSLTGACPMKILTQVSQKLPCIRLLFLAIVLFAIPLGTPMPITHSADLAPDSPQLPLLSSTFFGGAGDQRGTGIAISASIYVSGAADLNGGDGLVATYSLPLLPAATPVWSKTWPTLAGYDDFAGVGVSPEGVYLGGQSFNRTTDTVGGKEGKGITVKFPLTGPPGGGFDGSTWDVQSPAPPGAFPYGGGEGLNAATVAIETGLPFVYVTGNSQSSGINGCRLYVSKLNSAGTVLWTQTDAAATPCSQGLGITTLSGNVYAAGHNDDAGSSQAYLVKYAAAGGPATWTRKSISFIGSYFGVTASGTAIYAFGQRSGGVGGSSDFLIEKWDEAGTLQWSKQYDRLANEDVLYGGVVVGTKLYAVGSTIGGSAGGRDAVILQLDPATGDLQNTTLFGGAQDDIGRGAATDGTSIYVVGESRSFASGTGNVVGQNDLMLLKFGYVPTAAPASISGQILTPVGAPLGGATVRLTGQQSATTITDSSGNYRFDHVDTDGFYTVTPSRMNYHFNPDNRSFSLLGSKTDAVFTAEADVVIAGSPIEDPEYFVRQHYLDFLGREPDGSGFTFWSNQISSCGSNHDCVERRTINVSAAYFLSIEFQQTGGLVYGLYRASYDRAPHYAEFMPDARRIAQQVLVNTDGWQQQLAANKANFIEGFVNRAAFHAAYDGLSSSDYVDALISHTGVSFSSGEREALVGGLSEGTLTRAAALQRIVENQQFTQAKRNEMFVMMEYFGYLRRDPDAGGFAFWLNKLNQFGGNFEQAEMVKAFINSGEYRGRFPR
jgi:hypothetical protein